MTTPVPWCGPVIDTHDKQWPLFERVRELCAFIDTTAGSHVGVYRTEYDVIDLPLLRITRYVKDEHGHSIPGRDGYLERVTTEHPLRTPLPDWWQPACTQ